jgi:predicted permease
MSLEHWIYKLPLRLRSLFRRNRVEYELSEELQYHLDREIEILTAQGMLPEQARAAVLRKMSGLEQQKERCREARQVGLIEDLVADTRYALRSFRKTPSLSAVIIASLALGIGANTAIFSVINAVSLKLLPVRDPERLLLLNWSAKKWPEKYVSDLEGNSFSDAKTGLQSSYSLSSNLYQHIKTETHVFDNVVAFAANDEDVNVGLNGRAESAHLQAVSGDFFDGIGVTPVRGRLLLPSDDADSAAPAVVVSYSFWQQHFGNDSTVDGKHVVVDGVLTDVVGVTPPEFFGVSPGTAIDLWVPLTFYSKEWIRLAGPDEPLSDPKIWWLGVIGRVKSGLSDAQATSEAQLLFAQQLNINKQSQDDPHIPNLQLVPAKRGLNSLRDKFSTSLLLLMGMVGLVLLIACTNVAGLLMARATARQREIAVRLSLGAARGRIIRQLLTESVLLGILGGGLGLLLSRWASSAVVALLGSGRDPIVLSVHADVRILAFTAVVSVLSGVLFGLAPAAAATRIDVIPALKESASSVASTSNRRLRLGKILVAGQVALSLLLLISAGLMLRTLRQLQEESLGFDRENLLTFQVRPGLNGYKQDKLAAYYQELQTRLKALPGVSSAAFSQFGPINQGMSINTAQIPGYTATGKDVDVYRHIVGPDYFRTLNIPLVLGRPLTQQDSETAPKAIVVNETLVRKSMHGDNPIGKRIAYGRGKRLREYEIVGVAKDVKYARIREEAPPTVYWPYRQSNFVPDQMTFLVRVQGNSAGVMDAIRKTCLQLDKDVPLVKMQTETDVIGQALFLERTFALLSSSFGTLALLLACVGLYGTVAYAVTRRTNEIGVRMALGAERGRILRMVLFETGIVVVLGVVAGLPVAWAGAKLLKHQLYGLSPHDPATIVGSGLAIFGVALAAGYLPARRASQVDPMVALRCE